jgi:hypothetical protein
MSCRLLFLLGLVLVRFEEEEEDERELSWRELDKSDNSVVWLSASLDEMGCDMLILVSSSENTCSWPVQNSP